MIFFDNRRRHKHDYLIPIKETFWGKACDDLANYPAVFLSYFLPAGGGNPLNDRPKCWTIFRARYKRFEPFFAKYQCHVVEEDFEAKK